MSFRIRRAGALLGLLAVVGCSHLARVEPLGVRSDDWATCHAYGEAEAADDRVRGANGTLPYTGSPMDGMMLLAAIPAFLGETFGPTPDAETLAVQRYNAAVRNCLRDHGYKLSDAVFPSS
jgi:hypothetical protein